jgi:hypothetical protein
MIFNADYVRGVIVQELKETFEDLKVNIDRHNGDFTLTDDKVDQYASEMMAAFESHNIVVVKSSPLSY